MSAVGSTNMSWLGYIILFLQWKCCAFQQEPVFHQEQVAYQELVDPFAQQETPRPCGPPPVIDNSVPGQYLKRVFPSGSQVLYQCYRIFEMEGTPLAVCLNGRWKGVPRCHETCKAEELEMEHNNIYLRHFTKSTSHRTSDYWMYFDCKPGYRKDPLSPSFTKQCVRGPWVYPRCIL